MDRVNLINGQGGWGHISTNGLCTSHRPFMHQINYVQNNRLPINWLAMYNWAIYHRYRDQNGEWHTTVRTEALVADVPDDACNEFVAKSPYDLSDLDILDVRKLTQIREQE